MLALGMIIYLILNVSSQHPTKEPRPFHDVVADTKQFFDGLQHIIALRVDGQGPEQQNNLLTFQKEQQRLIDERNQNRRSPSQLGQVLNSVYTPQPIYVPQVSHLLQLPGSCHPAHAQNEIRNMGSQKVCQKCDKELIALFPTILNEERCQTHPVVAIYHCEGYDYHNDDTNDHYEPVMIPCQSAFVDGGQQFWALYSIATIFAIASAILVRRRFDKARQKVLSKLVKPK